MASTNIAIAPTDRRVVNLRLEKFRNRDIGNIISAEITIIITFRIHYWACHPNASNSVTIKSWSKLNEINSH